MPDAETKQPEPGDPRQSRVDLFPRISGASAVSVDICVDAAGSISQPGSVITVRRIHADEGAALRAIRLAALRDSPSAFGSTYQAEEAHTARHWAQRARHCSAGDDSATYFATIDERVVGLVAAYRPSRAEAVVELVSMWTAPDFRRTGAARQLVDAVLEWARAGSAKSVELWVTKGNDPAIELYRSAGFRETGDHQALPSDPCKDEVRMRRPSP
jgi:ribosomal protein S18 acetylase RimI-like enzyme